MKKKKASTEELLQRECLRSNYFSLLGYKNGKIRVALKNVGNLANTRTYNITKQKTKDIRN